jgi:hypothetical protein
MFEKFLTNAKALIESVNSIGMQVWAIVILLIGAVLTGLKQHETASMVIGGALALLQHPKSQA